jgi:hypothetical protein
MMYPCVGSSTVTNTERHLSQGGGTAVRLPARAPRFFRARWREEFPCQSGVYLRRWYFETPLFSIRLHHWLHSDDVRHLHDHTWGFVTFVLRGGYRDLTASGYEEMPAGKFAYRPANHRHAVVVNSGGCWTVLLTGPRTRMWGFWVGEKFVKSTRYFRRFGSQPCE